MNSNNRNICISIRQKNYVFLKGFASKKKQTTTDLVKNIALAEVDIEPSYLDLLKELDQTIYELKELGKVWNIQTKQINANIENRAVLDRGMIKDILYFVDAAVSKYNMVRHYSSAMLHENITYKKSLNLKKQNDKKLKFRRWVKPRFSIDLTSYEIIEQLAKSNNTSINKYINERIMILQNQSCFEKYRVVGHCRSILNLLSNIKSNAAQIWRNKKKNARANEVVLAKELNNFLSDIIEDFSVDPLLFSGRKFNHNFYIKAVNYVK